jgi:hypothetical protein
MVTMTWHADQTEGRLPPGPARDKLLAERAALVKKIEMKSLEAPARSNAGRLGQQEDLTLLAKKVLAIDKKLGR